MRRIFLLLSGMLSPFYGAAAMQKSQSSADKMFVAKRAINEKLLELGELLKTAVKEATHMNNDPNVISSLKKLLDQQKKTFDKWNSPEQQSKTEERISNSLESVEKELDQLKEKQEKIIYKSNSVSEFLNYEKNSQSFLKDREPNSVTASGVLLQKDRKDQAVDTQFTTQTQQTQTQQSFPSRYVPLKHDNNLQEMLNNFLNLGNKNQSYNLHKDIKQEKITNMIREDHKRRQLHDSFIYQENQIKIKEKKLNFYFTYFKNSVKNVMSRIDYFWLNEKVTNNQKIISETLKNIHQECYEILKILERGRKTVDIQISLNKTRLIQEMFKRIETFMGNSYYKNIKEKIKESLEELGKMIEVSTQIELSIKTLQQQEI